MITFKDLKFKDYGKIFPHFKTQSKMEFNNGYGISVISGHGAYSGLDTFEVAVLFNGGLCYTTHITDNVLSYQTEDNVTNIMKMIQEL